MALEGVQKFAISKLLQIFQRVVRNCVKYLKLENKKENSEEIHPQQVKNSRITDNSSMSLFR